MSFGQKKLKIAVFVIQDCLVILLGLPILKIVCTFSHQDKLRDRDAQIEEYGKNLSEKQDSVSRLEQDLSNCRKELTEREKRINDILLVEVRAYSLS